MTRTRAAVASAGRCAAEVPVRPTLQREGELRALGYTRIAGVDEAGRGPLAGPVVAAAVVLPQHATPQDFPHLNDSKQLAPSLRAALFEQLTVSVEYGVGIVDAATIDDINIRQASWRAMQQAVADLQGRASSGTRAQVNDDVHFVLIDGLGYGAGPWPYEAIVKGDAKSLSIAAASVIAKETRDRLMIEYSHEYSEYGFEQHKGYPSPQHLRALSEHGPCVLHRKTFGPVRAVIAQAADSELPLNCRLTKGVL